MLEIGRYKFPDQVTFSEALKIAELAISKFEGKMSNKDVAEALGYTIKDPNAISGYIFRKFDDLCAYGLMKRQRGYVKTTEIAVEALDPYDKTKAQEGKAKAIRQMPIVNDTFTKWNGELPSETALPAKLTEFKDISWADAQKHAENVRKLLSELFPYLKSTPQLLSMPQPPRDGAGGDQGIMESRQDMGDMTLSARGKGFGFTKTIPFTHAGIEELRKLTDFLELQVSGEKNEAPKKESHMKDLLKAIKE